LHSTTAVNSERATWATGRRGDGSTGRRGGEGALAWRDARGWSGRGGVSEEAAGGFGARRGGRDEGLGFRREVAAASAFR
jgi:hypothetical protein